MKYLFPFIAILFLSISVHAQVSVQNRVIFIGDAGEINFKQETIIPRAAELVIQGKTTVMFLGDNIYSHGIGLPGSKEEEKTKEILRSQFVPMRETGAPVYFIPGNHDWDRMGKLGLAKVRAQGNFLKSQQDSLLKLVPENGCPDPLAIPISDSLVIITYDSEWWLFPFEKLDSTSNCECNSESEILKKLEELLFNNRKKTILLASHHPLQSYGVHGGYYSWKDHIFPLTVLNKDWYIPMPIVGSLYPLLRSTVLLNPEDMPHSLYKGLIKGVNKVFQDFPNVLHVGGHEHGLQLIKDEDKYQIVSGSGAKSSYIKKGDNLLYGNSTQGFVIVDFMIDRSLKITYYTYARNAVEEVFDYTIPYKELN